MSGRSNEFTYNMVRPSDPIIRCERTNEFSSMHISSLFVCSLFLVVTFSLLMLIILKTERNRTPHATHYTCVIFYPCLTRLLAESHVCQPPKGRAGELSDQQVAEVKEAFDLFDTDGSGATLLNP